MRKNLIKEKIKQGKPAVGVGMLWDSPDITEFCGYLGFDWVWLDGEHGRFNPYNLWDTIRAAETGGITPVIRAPENDPKLFLKYLEAGMMGIIVPHVNTREDMVKAVNAVKYPPLGRRSSGAMRPAGYGISQHRKNYFQRANEETMVIALIEEPEGVDNIDDILGVEGLDAVVIGYGDLSMSMGYPGEKDHPEVQKLSKPAREKIVASDKWLQETVQDPTEARKAVETGANLVRCTMNSLFAEAATEYILTVRG